MKFAFNILRLSGASLFLAYVAASPVAIAPNQGPAHELAPLVGVITWTDRDGNVVAEVKQEFDSNQLRKAIAENFGDSSHYDPTEEEKAAASIVVALDEVDAKGLAKRGTRCYTAGSKIWASTATSYCNQLCNIQSSGYYVGAYVTATCRLLGIDVVSSSYTPCP